MENLMTIELEVQKASASTGMKSNGIDPVYLMNKAESITSDISLHMEKFGFMDHPTVNDVCDKYVSGLKNPERQAVIMYAMDEVKILGYRSISNGITVKK